jgi:hypothetical protein
MRNKLLTRAALLLASALVADPAFAQTPTHVWSQRFGNSSAQYGYAVATDPSGNVYVTGEFLGAIDFGGGPLTSAGDSDAFLAKFTFTGTHLWSQRFGDAAAQAGSSIATDGSGNVYLLGRYVGTVNFGGGNLVSAGNQDVFVARFNASGVHQWSRSFGSASDEFGNSIAVNSTGNVYITGEFPATIDFGGGVLTSAGGSDVFLAKFNNSGTHQWSKRFGDSSYQYAHGVAADASGNVCVTGDFMGTMNFGGGDLTSAGIYDIYLARFDASGAHQWSKRFGDGSAQLGQAVATDAVGSIYLAGHITGTADFGGGDLTSAGSYDVVLAKFNASGAHLWSKRFGDAENQYAWSVAAKDFGGACLTGYFIGTMDFGGGGLACVGASDAFLAKFDAFGAHQWSQSFGDASSQLAYGVAMSAIGGAHVTGEFQSTIQFGNNALVSAGQSDVFLATFDPMAREPLITSITDIGNDQGRKVKVRFKRSGFDAYYSTTPILRYDAFRRDDPAPLSASAAAGPTASSDREPLVEGWTQVGSVAAYGDQTYGIDVPTIGDSTIVQGQYHSTFLVRAATATPAYYFESRPDSGYSLDNLAPGVPGSFAYDAGLLSWDDSASEDFDYFSVYGSNTSSFASATLVDFCVAPAMVVTASPYVYYFVTATDFSGNEGAPAVVNTLSGVGGTPRSWVLSISAYPNPFNPETTIRYTVPSKGRVRVEIYDARGARVAMLINEEKDAGAYARAWNGRDQAGGAVSSGVYFARVSHDSRTRSYKLLLLK